jgi:hypothetical protein
MKLFVTGLLAAVAMSATIGTVDAQWRGRGWGRDRVIVQQAPAIGVGTIAAIIALQALNQPKQDTVVVQERQVVREREVVPFK